MRPERCPGWARTRGDPGTRGGTQTEFPLENVTFWVFSGWPIRGIWGGFRWVRFGAVWGAHFLQTHTQTQQVEDLESRLAAVERALHGSQQGVTDM